MAFAEQNTPPVNEEVAGRIALLKRFRALLVEQRERFQKYLLALDQQKKIIETGSIDDLTVHVALEEQIMADIFSVQKSLAPMRTLYESGWKQSAVADITELNAALNGLQENATRRINENKALLRTRMESLKGDLKTLRANNPFQRGRRSIYAEDIQGSLLDLKG